MVTINQAAALLQQSLTRCPKMKAKRMLESACSYQMDSETSTREIPNFLRRARSGDSVSGRKTYISENKNR